MESETGTHTLCEPAQSKCKYRHVTGAIVCGNLHEKIRFLDGVRDRDPHFVRACAVDMHTDMSQEPCGIYRENAARQSEHLDQAPASIPTARTHQCGHTFPGKNSSGSSVIRTWNSQHQECHDPETSRGIQKWKINGTIIHQIQDTPLKHCRFLQEKSASHTLEPQHVCVCVFVCVLVLCIFKP